ncbi:membrane protein insertion efficiency factor YidD [uncultured Corynebacterium sp.]|mgnify:CR=1 FL=1|uniref:membrane protein insertion efficiency factor YidD n=1 Tax=uncultured Corynebacterium sp. TaxID=159447 RepID=UPI002595BA9A|nr:membrane protein insertion efficiency factor YidD [uncultured Corynebacterium sp.]
MAYYNFLGGEIPPARGPAAKGLVGLVRLYQKNLSPLKMAGTCRFMPVCSAYALEAVSRHGAVKGSLLAATRVCKCGPWHPGGYDPVPGSVASPDASEAAGSEAAPPVTD